MATTRAFQVASETLAPGDSGAESPRHFTCALGRIRISIGELGLMSLQDDGGITRSLQVPIPEEAVDSIQIDRAWCAAVDTDVLVAIASTAFGAEGDSISGSLFRLGVDGQVRWATTIAGNMGTPEIHAGSCYVSGIGMVGKVDLATGRYAWRHDGLYRSPGRFVAFGLPRHVGAVVVFPAIHANRTQVEERAWPDEIEVDDQTGALRTPIPEGTAP